MLIESTRSPKNSGRNHYKSRELIPKLGTPDRSKNFDYGGVKKIGVFTRKTSNTSTADLKHNQLKFHP